MTIDLAEGDDGYREQVRVRALPSGSGEPQDLRFAPSYEDAPSYEEAVAQVRTQYMHLFRPGELVAVTLDGGQIRPIAGGAVEWVDVEVVEWSDPPSAATYREPTTGSGGTTSFWEDYERPSRVGGGRHTGG